MKDYPNSFSPIKRRGYFGIGIEAVKSSANIGTIWRSAQVLGADFIFIIDKPYKTMKTDTQKSSRHIPLFEYENFEQFHMSMPKGAKLVGFELDARSQAIVNYTHPQQAIYLLGSEDKGLSAKALSHCHDIIQIPGKLSLNVSVAASIVLYDRLVKNGSFIADVQSGQHCLMRKDG